MVLVLEPVEAEADFPFHLRYEYSGFKAGSKTGELESSWNVMAHGDARAGKWRENWRVEWAAITLYTTSEHGLSNITTVDAHTSAASSRLNWRYPTSDLNGLVCFAERRNLVSVLVPSHFKRSLLWATPQRLLRAQLNTCLAVKLGRASCRLGNYYLSFLSSLPFVRKRKLLCIRQTRFRKSKKAVKEGILGGGDGGGGGEFYEKFMKHNWLSYE